MARVSLTLDQIAGLAEKAFLSNGCDKANTEALVRTVVNAESDGYSRPGSSVYPGT